jgi:AsnC-like helix-turn-helix protein
MGRFVSVRAYILVRFENKADLSRIPHAMNQPGIKSVDLTMGPYDAIVTVEVADFAQLGELAKAIRNCPGLRDSITCPVV